MRSTVTGRAVDHLLVPFADADALAYEQCMGALSTACWGSVMPRGVTGTLPQRQAASPGVWLTMWLRWKLAPCRGGVWGLICAIVT